MNQGEPDGAEKPEPGPVMTNPPLQLSPQLNPNVAPNAGT